ncbi:unnamed protein product [Durusdinium trenchii]|uniref:Uncharacterized protein n=1 Tax=Durusdinium trenchii TaxID=1381693 RepID=A0ABP0PPF1_9DINO
MLSWSNSSPVKDLPVFERSEGVYLYDSNGKRYLDWTSQAVCVNLGYTVPESIKDRAEFGSEKSVLASLEGPYGAQDPGAQGESGYGGLGLAPVRAKLARLMAEICPGDLNGFLFPSGGGEANEAAIRMARLYTGKQKIFTQYRSYHGGSTSSLGATGDFRRRFTESNTHGFVKFFNPQPSGFSWGSTDQSATRRTLATLEDQILAEGPDTIAAIMVESRELGESEMDCFGVDCGSSIVGAGGVLVPPEGYIEGVRSLCDKYDILMICDEVMVGFGRTGHFFAFQHFEGVIPDMVTSAKGLTGSYLPLSMVGVRQKIKNYFWEKPVGWGATYHAHPVAVACAYETVKYMLKEKIVEKVQSLEHVMMQELQNLVLKHDSVRQARNVGLFGCLDLQNPNGHFIQRLGGASPPEVQLLRQAMRDQGLMALFRPPLLHCAPPLVIQARRGAHCGELRSLRCAVLLVWRDPTSRAIFLAYNLGWCYLESVPMVLFVFRVIWSDLRCQSASLLWEFKHLNFMRCTRIIRWASNRLPYTTWGSRVDTPCNDYLDFSGSQIV